MHSIPGMGYERPRELTPLEKRNKQRLSGPSESKRRMARKKR